MDYVVQVKVRVRRKGEKPVVVNHCGVYEAENRSAATAQALQKAQERCLSLLVRMDEPPCSS